MARFKRGSTELRVETPKRRLRPALIWDNGISYNGNYYSFEFSDNQSYENQWGVGTYEMEVEVLNFKTTVPFVIKPSPVKSADLTVSNLYEGIDSSKRWNEDYESDGYWIEEDNATSAVSSISIFIPEVLNDEVFEQYCW